MAAASPPDDAVFTVDLRRLKIENGMEVVDSGHANDREFFRDVAMYCLLMRRLVFWRRDGELRAVGMDDIVELFRRAEPVAFQKPMVPAAVNDQQTAAACQLTPEQHQTTP